MNAFTGAFSALMIILRSTGPVDLNTPVAQIGRNGRHGPVTRRFLSGRQRRVGLDKVGQGARIELGLALLASRQQLQPARVESAVAGWANSCIDSGVRTSSERSTQGPEISILGPACWRE